MKSIIKLTCIMMALLSMLVIAGCSNKPDYTGTWIGYDGENALYRLTIQENGKEYMVTDMYPLYWTLSKGGIFMRYSYEFKKK